jgi:tetratricopeptide (TPR) repeat protein
MTPTPLPTTGPADLVAAYDVATERLARFHVDIVEQSEQLAAAAGFPMGQVLAAYLALISTDRPDLAAARTAASALQDQARNDRETAHLHAIEAWLGGDWHGAARALDDLLVSWPTDVLALQVGHQLDFFLGDAANLRDRIARSRLAFDPDDRRYGYVLGMQSFGLEESGSYDEAEETGLEALDRHPDDVWAVHAVVHSYEMRGLVDDGARFLQTRQPGWTGDNLFTVHNWWHYALFLLEAGRPDAALAVYDGHLHNDASVGVPLEMLDASALLWRLRLDDVGTGGRFDALADAWATRAGDDSWYVFNDLHAVMAFVGAGRLGDARATVDRLERTAAGPPGSNQWMTAEVGLPASRAVLAFGEERYDDVVALLTPIRATTARFGGSHAQRDALQRTLLEGALRAGRFDLARALLSERLSLRDSSVYGWTALARLRRAAGDDAGAEEADRRAGANRERFAAAVTLDSSPPAS